MVLLAAVILPHGAMPYDGDPNSPSEAVRKRRETLDPGFKNTLTELYNGICEAAQTIAALEAELYIVHTPHGISLSESYGIYGNTSAQGDALWLGEWSEFKASAALDQTHSDDLKKLWTANGISTEKIICYGGGEDIKLRWGEAIPIWFLQKYIKNDPKYMLISQDTKPRTGVIEDWRLNIGKKLASFAHSLPERVVIVISGDLSHCHATDCSNPLYLPSPSYQPSEPFSICKEKSKIFEESVCKWIKAGSPTRWDPTVAMTFLSQAVALDPFALACGMKGITVLHGVLSELATNCISVRTRLVVHKVPTYYGMLAATFIVN